MDLERGSYPKGTEISFVYFWQIWIFLIQEANPSIFSGGSVYFDARMVDLQRDGSKSTIANWILSSRVIHAPVERALTKNVHLLADCAR